MWAREPGFPTLLYIILEQQVSLASARAAYDRLIETIGVPTPEAFLNLSDSSLKAIGFSRQKARYCRLLAESILIRKLDLATLTALSDDAVRSELTSIKGIGPWTADIYLLMALRRPDIWPTGDMALATAVRRVKGLDSRPSPNELNIIAANWRPWRSVAARLLWHYYLSESDVRI